VSYTIDELRALKSQTDWERLDKLTDEDIDRQCQDDPDWQGFDDIDWSKAEWVPPLSKQAISIRLDPDVLAFFKDGGPGYQSRINAVLRAYVEAKKKV
jgi:uncharacterized protein (DUF4415 family)